MGLIIWEEEPMYRMTVLGPVRRYSWFERHTKHLLIALQMAGIAAIALSIAVVLTRMAAGLADWIAGV